MPYLLSNASVAKHSVCKAGLLMKMSADRLVPNLKHGPSASRTSPVTIPTMQGSSQCAEPPMASLISSSANLRKKHFSHAVRQAYSPGRPERVLTEHAAGSDFDKITETIWVAIQVDLASGHTAGLAVQAVVRNLLATCSESIHSSPETALSLFQKCFCKAHSCSFDLRKEILKPSHL